jgi:hypothetical protein
MRKCIVSVVPFPVMQRSRALAAILVLVFVGCTGNGRSVEAVHTDGGASGKAEGGTVGKVLPCPPTDDLIRQPAGDEGQAVSTAVRFLRSLTPSHYDPHVAWSMLDNWYSAEMGWHFTAQFTRSPEAQKRSLDGIKSVRTASLLANDRRVQRTFILARTGITSETCDESELKALVRGVWYVTLWPKGGNAPGYVVMVHRSSGYTVLHAD